jgi:tRNA(His) 5'-end guanylyltransferase
MKECEIFSQLKVPCGSKILLRLDGRGFYKLSQQICLKKPYDSAFVEAMVNTGIELFQEFSPSFIYTFSDEFNILLSDIPFSGRIEKLNSVFASFTANSFFSNILKSTLMEKESYNNKGQVENIFQFIKTISFDCRVIPLSVKMVPDYFKGRQDEAWRNCLNGYAYWTLRKKMDKKKAMNVLSGLKSNQIHDLLFEEDIQMGEIPAWQRRGIGIYKIDEKVNGYNPVRGKKVKSSRKRIFSDCNLPRFEVDFFQKITND